MNTFGRFRSEVGLLVFMLFLYCILLLLCW